MENPGTGLVLKQLREKWGMNQTQVAAFLGVDRSAVSQWETGERPIPAKYLSRVADLFGVEAHFFTETDPLIQSLNLAVAFRAGEYSQEDLIALATFNRITRNYVVMRRMLQEPLPVADEEAEL